MESKLSIIIPTYNREKQLINQLRRIYSQQESKFLKIVVLNNNSDYNVEYAITSNFECSQLTNLKIISHPYNLGGNMNIGLSFYHCETDWLWLLSDDDEVLCDSIKRILDDICTYNEYIAIKYSLEKFTSHDDVEIGNLNDLIRYYKKEHKHQGELIFMSNAVFNINKLRPVMGAVIENAYNSLPGLNPILFGLDKALGKCFFSNKQIVRYMLPAPGGAWNYHQTTVRLPALLDYPFNCDGKTMLKLMSLMNHWNYPRFILACADFHDSIKSIIFYKKIFDYVFQIGWLKKNIYKIVFYLNYLTNFKFVDFIKNRKAKK